MPERQDYIKNQENLITRVNYSSKLKGTFGIVIFGATALALKSLERGPSSQYLPSFMRGRLFDVMSAPWEASLSKMLVGDSFRLNAGFAFTVPALIEATQGVGFSEGTFDEGDFAAYAIGTLGWIAFEGTAKVLHDSGLTLPLYRVFGIRHKKFG